MPSSGLQTRAVRIIPWFVIGAALFVYLVWEIARRGTYMYDTAIYSVSDADEWRYTACSRLVEHGYSLFTQVFSAQPPLLFASLALGMRLTEDSIAGARWVEIVLGLVALASTAWLAGQLAGRWAAAVASLLLAVSPGFLLYSHTIEAEGPQMALVTLSLALTIFATRRTSFFVVLIAGLSLAAAILIKLFAVEAFLPALWLLWRWSSEPRRDLLAFVTAAVVPVALDFALIAPRAQWQQVVAMHNAAASIALPDVTPPSTILANYLALDAGLTILAAAAFVTLVMRNDWDIAVLFVLWPGATLVMLYAFKPLFPHHPAILATGLAALAGVGAGRIIGSPVARRVSVVMIIGILGYLGTLPRLVHADRHLLVPGRSQEVVALTRFVDRHSASGAMVAADDLQVADSAGRLVPPPLCDPSNVRLRAGYLTGATAIDATEAYRPQLVMPSFGIYQQIPGYLAWVARHYTRVDGPDGETVYERRSS